VKGSDLYSLSSRDDAHTLFRKMGVQQKPSRVFFTQLQKLKETLIADLSTDLLVDTIADLGTQLSETRHALEAEKDARKEEERRNQHLAELAERRRLSSRKFSQQVRRSIAEPRSGDSNSAVSDCSSVVASSPTSPASASDSEPPPSSPSSSGSDSEYRPENNLQRDDEGRFSPKYFWQMFLLIVILRSLGVAAHAVADTVKAVKGMTVSFWHWD
jgi:hypothetical protein